ALSGRGELRPRRLPAHPERSRGARTEVGGDPLVRQSGARRRGCRAPRARHDARGRRRGPHLVNQEYVVDGTGPALVLLHGGMSNRDDFDAQLAELISRYRVGRPDRRGHGTTPDVPGPITYDNMADDTIELLVSVVGEPAHVIGSQSGRDGRFA